MVQKLLKIVSLASLLVHTVCNYLGSANLATSNLSPPLSWVLGPGDRPDLD